MVTIDEFGKRIDDAFDKRISKISFIQAFAKENKISYSQAKEIYDKRYSNEAQIISKYASRNHVPYELIISMIEDDGLSFSDINYYSINEKIYEVFFKEGSKNKDLLLIKDYSGYIEEVRRRLGTSVTSKSIPQVIDEIQKDIYQFAQKNNVSSAVATLCVCYGLNITQAEKTINFLTYNEKNNIESSHSIVEDYTKFLNANSNLKRTTLHGINIISPTQEGLDRLIEIVEQAFANGDDDYKKQLEQLAKENNLVLTNVHFEEDTSTAFYNSNLIFISLNLNKDLVNVFFHESTHFIDSKTGQNEAHYSYTEGKVWDVFKKIEERINNKPYDSIINNPNVPQSIKKTIVKYANMSNKGITEKGIDFSRKGIEGLAEDYIYDPTMIEKWKKEIEEQYAPETVEERREYLLQKQRYEREKYICLLDPIYDIYDGIAKGRLRDKYNTYGHGRNYYSSDGSRLGEFIANIGIFYNNNCDDVLTYEFGEELSKELIGIYNELLQKRKELNASKQVEQQKEELNAMLAESQQISIEMNNNFSK